MADETDTSCKHDKLDNPNLNGSTPAQAGQSLCRSTANKVLAVTPSTLSVVPPSATGLIRVSGFNSDLDEGDGFPRYFFGTADEAKAQMETWLNRREAYRASLKK